MKLSQRDRERLEYALGSTPVNVTKSLFGPGSLTWEVNREAVLLAGGGCALLLQVAHPLVAAGVAEHSNFRERPLDRLYRTLDLMLTITFAPAAQAVRAVREIERRHAPVRGYLAEAAGPFVRGTPYRASDPALLFWVHATLVHTAAQVFEMFVRPLTAAELARYYDESKVIARLFGVAESDIPPTWRRFQDYFERMVKGEELAVSEQSRAIARAILWPERPLWLRGVMPPARLLSIGLLPEPVRARYGFRWPAWQEHAFRALVAAGQLALPWVPRSLRDFPHAREGQERERQPSPLGTLQRSKSVAA